MQLDLARWQFAFISVNHFFFVPVTIGLAFLTALLQTAWYSGGRPEYLPLTNPIFLWGYAHVLLASLVTGAAVMLAVPAWQLRRGGEREVFTRSAAWTEGAD